MENLLSHGEDIIIKIDNSFKIESINIIEKSNANKLEKEYSQWLIDFKVIGAIVMVDYSTVSLQNQNLKITF